MSYKKVRTVFINDKKKVIYMKAKGTREYVKSKGEMVLLTSYLKKVEKVAAKKAMASKLAKKSPKVKRSTKYVRRGGFFFATDENKEKEKTGGLNFTPPGGVVGVGSTQPNNSQPMPSQQMSPSTQMSQQMPQQMSQQMPPQMPPQMPQQMSQQMPEKMMGGYYNVHNNNAEIFKGAQQVVDQLFGELNKAAQVTGGKKAKKGKKVMKKETNPFKNFMNTLSLKKKQRKGKKRGGNEGDGDVIAEVY
jgi:hypothetical protein